MQRLSERRRAMGAGEDSSGFYIRGKFRDDSTREDWWLYWNGSNSDSGKLSLVAFTDPDTKEFEYVSAQEPSTLARMFYMHQAIGHIYELSVGGKVASLRGFLYGSKSILSADLSGVNASAVTDFDYMFYMCEAIQNINVAFKECAQGKTFISSFYNCHMAELAINIDFNAATSLDGIFGYCSNLRDVTGKLSNIKLNLDLQSCSALTPESVEVFLDGLAVVDTPRTLKLYSKVKENLTPEQRAVAENKGWIIA